MLRGLMMKHQRVHMAPVAMRAAFCDSERTSAGRAKSAAPARTTPHCQEDDELAHVGKPDLACFSSISIL